LAISRALCKINEEYRADLKPEGLLTRDPRMVERKKFGQKKARKNSNSQNVNWSRFAFAKQKVHSFIIINQLLKKR